MVARARLATGSRDARSGRVRASAVVCTGFAGLWAVSKRLPTQ
jgi:hypothetical protein